MNRKEIWPAIEQAVRKHRRSVPDYPEHILAQVGSIGVPFGKLMGVAYDFKFAADNIDQQKDRLQLMEWHAIEVAARAIRFLENLKTAQQWQKDSQTEISGRTPF